MTEIFEFILSNYVWILVIVLLILLAIIGSVAEKSVFGDSNKTNELDDREQKNEVVFSDKKIGDVFKQNDTIDSPTQAEMKTTSDASYNNNINFSIDNNNLSKEQTSTVADDIKTNLNGERLLSNLEEKLKTLDNEINGVLPKKQLIEDNVLEDIDDLSIDFNNKLNKKDNVDLTNIDLPDVRNTKVSKKNIWR